MNNWTVESIAQAEREILAIMQMQNPTGRTDTEYSYFMSLIAMMKEKNQLTPSEAVLKARLYADSRQDGHGGGVIQDGY